MKANPAIVRLVCTDNPVHYTLTDCKHRLHLDHGEVPVSVLQLLLILFNFPLLASIEVGRVSMSLLDLFQLLTLLLYLCLELLIFLSAVH